MLSVERGGSSRGAWAAAGPFAQRRLSLPYLDVPALLAVAVLVLLGVANLDALGGRSLAEHQLLAVLAGLVMFVVLRRVRAEQLRRLSWWCYGLSLLLLL